MFKSDTLDLENLVLKWKRSCKKLDSSIYETLKVKEIIVDVPDWDWYDNEYIDWWSNNQLDRNLEILKERGTRGLYNLSKTKKGTRTTAELLWEFRDDPETRALIWIAASMWDNLKYLPNEWRGNTFEKTSLLLQEIEVNLKNKGYTCWHHSCKDALPIKLQLDPNLHDALLPQTYEHLIGLSALESAMVYSNWTIVRLIVKEDSPYRRIF